MKKIITLAAISCTTIALTACGDDVTNVTENNVGVQSFESFKKLPDCTKDNQGEMAIATKEGLVYYCDDEKWKKLNGEDGIDGKDGEKGDKGETGDKGEQGKKGDKGETGDKGEQGKKGDAGADGVDGKDGSNGINGENGKNGEPGSSCTIAELEDKTGYKVLCGGDSVGVVLNGKAGDAGVNGFTMCGIKSYNPNESVCVNEKLYPRCGETYYYPKTQVCVEGKVEYIYGELVDDRDDSTYKTIEIGKQTWMAENLKHVTENSYCHDDDADCTKYGRYYTWAAAMGKSEEECGYGYECVGIVSPHQGVCPGGWHLPTIEEWEALKEFISKDQEKSIETVGYYLKTNSGWFDYGNGNDYYGFSALPAGYYVSSYFYGVGSNAYFWSATEYSSNNAYHVFMFYYSDDLYSYNYDYKNYAYSVRCVKD